MQSIFSSHSISEPEPEPEQPTQPYTPFIGTTDKDQSDFIAYILHLMNEFYDEYNPLNQPNNIAFFKTMFFTIYNQLVEEFTIYFDADIDADADIVPPLWDELELIDIIHQCLHAFIMSNTRITFTKDAQHIDWSIIHQEQNSRNHNQTSNHTLSNYNNEHGHKDDNNEKTRQWIRKRIHYLINVPQPQQRTKEWYEFRYNLITASNAYKALGSQAAKNSLIVEKCAPLVIPGMQNSASAALPDDDSGDEPDGYGYSATKYVKMVNTNNSRHWGQKYEPLSVKIYEMLNSTTIQDVGCIQHRHYSFLGASPDGINNDPKSPHTLWSDVRN